MTKKIFFITITFIISWLMASCEKWPKDDALTLEKRICTDNSLRFDGYYYEMNAVSNSFSETYFLYRDGTILSFCGTPDNKPPFTFIEDLILSGEFSYKNSKSLWGVFQIKDTSIIINRWFPGNGGLRAALLQGVILNDSTFKIISTTETTTGTVHHNNDLFHFHAFSPKPDSTNVFIP